jgi:hypothetical protein
MLDIYSFNKLRWKSKTWQIRAKSKIYASLARCFCLLFFVIIAQIEFLFLINELRIIIIIGSDYNNDH